MLFHPIAMNHKELMINAQIAKKLYFYMGKNWKILHVNSLFRGRGEFNSYDKCFKS